MSKRKKQNIAGTPGAQAAAPGMITTSGIMPRPGQSAPGVVILTAPRRFGIDIADYMQAVRSAENVDMPSRTSLYDLYTDILADTHLSSVIDKRVNAVLATGIEFRKKDNTPHERINEQIRSPWFSRLVHDILMSRFWGFSLFQFYRDGDWVDYNLIPRKNACPVRRIIKHLHSDQHGHPWSEYPRLLFVGEPEDLGLLAKAAPWVIYKRNTTGDWSQFSEVFGMPIQEYTYDSDDDDSRKRAIADARATGSLATFIHGKDTSLNLLEAGNKTGSADVYERFIERCNSEISKLVLGNTLTTESSETGTQALGTVHKKSEDSITQADRRFLLNVLNYDLVDILAEVGIDADGGSFYFPDKKIVDDTTRANILVQLKNTFSLPVSDDYLYETFGIDKPDDYDSIKQRIAQEQEQEQERQSRLLAVQALGQALGQEQGQEQDSDTPDKTTFKDRLRSFFGIAPRDGADSDW